MKKSYFIFIIVLYFFNIMVINAVDIKKAYDYSYEEITLDITSKHVILYNLTDNYKLLDMNGNEKVQVASLTKIMTSIVAIENIKNLDDKVTIKSNVFNGINDPMPISLLPGMDGSDRHGKHLGPQRCHFG